MFACLYSPPASGVSHDVLERVARDFSPRIETPRESLVLLDISGLDRLIGGPQVIAEELQHALVMQADTAGLSASAKATEVRVAVAGTRVAAQLLARHLPGLTVIEPGSESIAIAALPLCSLTPLGAPLDLVTTLERWGLRTLGEFAALPAKQLASRLDSDGLAWQRVARGEDSRPLVPARLEERFEDMLDLEWPIEGIEPLAFVLGRLLDPLCTRLERRDRAVAAVTLRLRFAVSRTWQTRRLEMPSPMREPRMLRTLLCLDLEGHPEVLVGPEGNPEGIDRVGLFIEPTPGRVAQFSLLTRPAVAPEAVATLMARLRALMGHDRCGTARLVDTHRPGAFAMADVVMANAGPTLRSDVSSAWIAGPSFSSDVSSAWIVGPSFSSDVSSAWIVGPSFSSDVSGVSGISGASVTPDLKVGPTRSGRALRRFRHPIPARVAVEHGRPVRVVTDRRGWNGGRVIWCAGPWRASGDWWKHEHDSADHAPPGRLRQGYGGPPKRPANAEDQAAAPYSWQEWDVALNDGGHYRIHEDLQQSHWFIDAILD